MRLMAASPSRKTGLVESLSSLGSSSGPSRRAAASPRVAWGRPRWVPPRAGAGGGGGGGGEQAPVGRRVEEEGPSQVARAGERLPTAGKEGSQRLVEARPGAPGSLARGLALVPPHLAP